MTEMFFQRLHEQKKGIFNENGQEANGMIVKYAFDPLCFARRMLATTIAMHGMECVACRSYLYFFVVYSTAYFSLGMEILFIHRQICRRKLCQRMRIIPEIE